MPEPAVVANQPVGRPVAPSWDGAVSAREVDRITAWPDIPLQILRHDSDVYRDQQMWDAEVEDAWIAGQADFARPAPTGVVSEVPDAGHYVHLDEPQIAADAVRRVLDLDRKGRRRALIAAGPPAAVWANRDRASI